MLKSTLGQRLNCFFLPTPGLEGRLSDELDFSGRLINPVAGLFFDLTGGVYQADGCRFVNLRKITNLGWRGASFWRDKYEADERKLIKQFISSDDSVIELGACLGIVSCITNRLLKNPSKHLVVEANPYLIPWLVRNQMLNDAGFLIEHCAVGRPPETTLRPLHRRDEWFRTKQICTSDADSEPFAGRTRRTLRTFCHGRTGARVSDVDRLLFHQRADRIRQNTVHGIIATADDVAARAVTTGPSFGLGAKNDRNHDWATSSVAPLAHGINIVASECIVFAIRKFPFAIVVTLVAGDDDGDAVQFQFTDGFEDMSRAGAALVSNVSNGST